MATGWWSINVLPLVSAFIILFAIGSYTFIHSVRAAVQEKFHYTGALAVERKFANTIQESIYADQKGNDLDSTEKTTSTKKEDLEFKSPRDKKSRHNGRKLNIRPLLLQQNDSQLEKVTLTLLKEIYQNTSIYKKNMEREILAVLIATMKINPSINHFEDLLTKLPENDIPLFYKLIKGTQVYELKTNVGYPALGDFLSIDGKDNKRKPINFYKASRPVLAAVFGDKLSEQIIVEEGRKWEIDHKKYFLTKEELGAFLIKNTRNLSEFEPLLYFDSNSSKRTQEVVQDDGSKLQIRINL